MLKISPDQLPSRRPHISAFGNSAYAHMAVSMLILALAAGVAVYRIMYGRAHPRYSIEAIERDHVRKLMRAAEQGSAPAQAELASVLTEGIGVARDPVAAAHWNRSAAEQGELSAQTRLGRAYAYGQGVERDFQQAARWLKQAAEKGDVDAQFDFGLYRLQGIGVEKDVVDGARWLQRAATAGSAAAQAALAVVRQTLSADQVTAAGLLDPQALLPLAPNP